MIWLAGATCSCTAAVDPTRGVSPMRASSSFGALRKLLMDQWRDLPSAAAGCVVRRQQPTRRDQRQRRAACSFLQSQAAACTATLVVRSDGRMRVLTRV